MDAECADSSSSAIAPENSTSGSNTQVDEVKKQSSSSVKLLPPLSSLPINESMDLERAYSCRICFDQFTKETRYPVSLNCGHSFCVMCIKKMNKKKSSIMCGVCRKHTFSSHKRLGKNFLLIDILEKNGLLGVEEEKKAKPESKVERIFKHAENDDWSDPDDTDSTFEEDGYDGGAYPNDFNSFSIAVDEIEEFHDQLENIQDLLYGFERGVARNDDFDRQLEELRSEMGRVEQRMRSDRASFRNIAAKSRQLYQLVRQTGTAAAQQQSTNNNQQQTAAASTENSSNSNNLRTWLGNHFIFSGRGTDFLTIDPSTRSLPRTTYSFTDFAGDVSEEHLSAPSEDDWATSDGDDDFPSSRIARETRIVVFLSANFIRVLTRSSDNTQISQVECYLCNVVIQYSYQNAMQHINGRRHREYIRANQASPSEIAPAENRTSSSSVQPAQINALTWELDEDDATERQRDRDIILHALQNGNAFELGNTSNSAATASASWGSSTTNPIDTAQASSTSKNAQVTNPQSGLPTITSQSSANHLILNDFGGGYNYPNRTTFINNRAPVGSSRRDWFGRGMYGRQPRAARPSYTSAFSRSTFDNNRAVMEEQAENDDWESQPSNIWTPFVPQPVPARAATAPNPGQSSEQTIDNDFGDSHGNTSTGGTVRRPGFANSSANNSINSQESSNGRFGYQPPRNAQQQDHTYISTAFTPDSNLYFSSNNGSNQPTKKEDPPETSRPLLQPSAPNEWPDLSDRDESSPRRTRRRSRNSNASNTSSSNGNQRGRLHVSDVHRHHRNNRWGNDRGNNQSSLNAAIARNLGNIGCSNDWSDNDHAEESHPTPPNTEDSRQDTSSDNPPKGSSAVTNRIHPNHGTQHLRSGGSCNPGRGNCQCPRGSARTDGFGGRFGQNSRRGNSQSVGNGQGSSNRQNRNAQRGGRGSGGGRFSSNEWDLFD